MLIAVAAVVLVVAGVVIAVGVRHATRERDDRSYGPLESGSFYGPLSLKGLKAPAGDRPLRLAQTAGAVARFVQAVDNLGSHSVVVHSVDLSKSEAVRSVRWSTYRVRNGGSIFGQATPWRAFPAVVPAHGTIRLLVTIHKPSWCHTPMQENGGTFYAGGLTLQWSSLLGSHTAHLAIPGYDGIQVC